MKKWLFQFSLLRHECNYLFCMSTYFFKSYWIGSTPSILEVTPCDWQLKRATVFYYSICTIKSTFLLKPVFTLHVIEHLFHLLKCNVSQKKKKWERLVGKNSKVEKVLQEKKKRSHHFQKHTSSKITLPCWKYLQGSFLQKWYVDILHRKTKKDLLLV